MSAPAPMANPPSNYREPANDADLPHDDVREILRVARAGMLAAIDALRAERDADRSLGRLRDIRTQWIVHALSEETVVYRALEGVQQPSSRAEERFVEHELVGNLFERLALSKPGTAYWDTRLGVIRSIIAKQADRDLDPLVALRYDARQRREMGERFLLARDKLMVLELAKAA